jgi:hypothetical protein
VRSNFLVVLVALARQALHRTDPINGNDEVKIYAYAEDAGVETRRPSPSGR